ncbi:hypothetical protein AAFF_G00295830 [Aldrovandia affinis]|uniref:Chondroadherin-like protein n=1 Tax=Aldrovandia affinis TaxID=143900 RepID=A0AAD7SPY7_9TELE|nr:hypothetical protein AAFF_G00295830 [Aldrovandia affinis]
MKCSTSAQMRGFVLKEPRATDSAITGVTLCSMASDDVAQLAESLARTQVEDKALSYKGRGLKLDTAQSAEELVRDIEGFQGLQALWLEGNTIGVDAAQVIAKALEGKSQLQCCYWSDMFTGRLRAEIPPALTSLGGALIRAGACLTELDLSDNAFGPDGVRGIEALLKSATCHTLRELRLNNCGMGIGGGKILATALTECYKQSSAVGAPLRLKVFIAGRNRLENEGASALAKAFKLIGSLEEIHMPQNGINHRGVTALATAIQDNPHLRVINLNDNTFTKKGAIAMAQALKHLRSVQVVNFGDCLVRSEGAVAIAESLREGLPILKELNLSFGEIGEAAALELVQAVQDKAQLERLDLNGNCLGEEGCETLRDAMDGVNMRHLLGSLSDDEGEPEDDAEGSESEEEDEEGEDDDDDDDDDNDDDDKQAEDEAERTSEAEGSSEKTQNTVSLSVSPPLPPDGPPLLPLPSPARLLTLGPKRALLIEQQVDVADADLTAEAFLKISSVYRDDPEIKTAVLDSIDALLRKAFSSASFQTYNFVSTLLMMMGLLKGEEGVKVLPMVPGHLAALEHAVQQDYFPQDHVSVLDHFVSVGLRGLKAPVNSALWIVHLVEMGPMEGVAPLWPVVALLLLFSVTPAHLSKCPKFCICDNIQLTVGCIGKNLTEVPPTINEITVKLDLKGNNIQELPAGAFRHTPYLTHLSLQRSNIRSVREGAFRSLGRLVFLNLAHNNIDILYQESFDGLTSLKQLLIDHNRVEEIQPGAFTQLGFLNLLSLTHNQLVYVPNMAFQGLQNIKWMRLSHNSLNNLATEAFAGLFTLVRLSLDHNELQFFPTQTMTRLPELTRLDLGYNPMTYLGEETVAMVKLTHLFLDHMSLQDFSHLALALAPSLAHLDLSHNQLRVLQPLLGPLKLARLNLAGNPVYCNCYLRPLREWALRERVRLLGACAGPPHFSGEGLESMHPPALRCQSQEAMLRAEQEEEQNRATPPPTPKPASKVKCPVNCDCEGETHHSSCENRGHTKIPRGFSPETSLLDLRGNHFHYIPGNSFPGVAKVISLHLQRCKIHEIEASAFNGMRGLVYLYLSENDLSSLTPDAFKGVPQLTYLHLERNKFTQFPKAAFKLLPNLLALHLEHNSITRLEQGVLTGAERLRALFLTGNAIHTAAPRAFSPAPDLDTLHLGSNQLREVPTAALAQAPNLAELRLSGNPIRWVAAGAFAPFAGSLKHLYLDGMGLEKMSQDSLAGLGSGLRTLLLEGNQLEELPDLNPLSGLEVINLAENPLLCDCPLLPLRKWIDMVNLKVRASCGHPPELRGQRVKDVHIFKSCPGAIPPPTPAPKGPKQPKSTKPKPAHLNTPKVKPVKAKPKPRKTPSPKPPAAAPKTTSKKSKLP